MHVMYSIVTSYSNVVSCHERLFKKNHSQSLVKTSSLLESVILEGGNIFEAIMEASKSQSLGQITEKLFQLGGEYRRNM